jgi:Ser/Thr protein kinase RdoA (MazF antagonist)
MSSICSPLSPEACLITVQRSPKTASQLAQNAAKSDSNPQGRGFNRKGHLKGDHLHFRGDELALVLNRFDLGVISAASAFDRGCKRSPKAKIVSEKGKYLLKRRASGNDSPERVATAHHIQSLLQTAGFPLARLTANRVDGKTALVLDGNTYELFEYVHGKRCHGTSGQLIEAGATLAKYHQILQRSAGELNLPTGGVHQSGQVQKIFRKLVAMDLGDGNAALRASLQRALARLGTVYHTAATRVNQLGYPDWPLMVTHCDWHPGNLLFDGGHIRAVLDHDSPRLQPRVADIACGMLQFSIRGEAGAKTDFDPAININAARQLLFGYDSVQVVSVAEIKAIPWLMIEAIAARVAVGLASKLFDGAGAAASLILMMDARAAWMSENAQSVIHELLKPLDMTTPMVKTPDSVAKSSSQTNAPLWPGRNIKIASGAEQN